VWGRGPAKPLDDASLLLGHKPARTPIDLLTAQLEFQAF
jgi:hypothetical protein